MTGAVSPLLPGLIASFVLMAIGVIVGFTAVLIVASRHGTHGLMWVLALTLNIINLAVCVML